MTDTHDNMLATEKGTKYTTLEEIRNGNEIEEDE